ncbi:beta/alpha barrel domain-containing protein [Leptospira kanakyensis]|uniref:4-hydroxy-2-oxovalerate aldolase n=1 Tax=Leptospira kanakyensis TaxID=2484968 RepID=UPI00223D9F17|nr:4-hydroxy-2-oxovalerate aldolase [Leptospira kanakyensis]MCW7482140.1 4-hydroxy-2-oxovalerate aldolase [Leptospira kanakyensis]
MITIIENTLRDGSYVIDFQFGKSETSTISRGLYDLGFDYIEVGHGLGLGAWNKKECGLAKTDDKTYILSARLAAPKAKIGVFFIPGIGTKEDIDIAIDAGINFIRIGCNVDTYYKMREFADYAKKKGLLVAGNLMKSYAVKSYEFTKIAKEINRWECVDIIYLVDSAGCMIPQEVFEYIDRTKEQINLSLGFHGHNNLSMAVANSIEAVRAGASFVDSSIRGMGRSAGNAQTEILVYFLKKMNLINFKSDVYDFYNFANKYIVPLMTVNQGLSDEEIHIGISKFHSSYMEIANDAAKKYGVDKKKLIKKVSDINCINPSREFFLEIASQLANNG